MIVVSDTGPLIALAKVDQLDVLLALFREVHIPLAVQRELFTKLGPESTRLEGALQSFLKLAPSPPASSAVVNATVRLHPGEREAIALAFEHQALLLVDDRLGRSAARRLGVAVTGVVGVLLQAKEAGHLYAVRPILVEMRQRAICFRTRYWFWPRDWLGSLEHHTVHSALISGGGLSAILAVSTKVC